MISAAYLRAATLTLGNEGSRGSPGQTAVVGRQVAQILIAEGRDRWPHQRRRIGLVALLRAEFLHRQQKIGVGLPSDARVDAEARSTIAIMAGGALTGKLPAAHRIRGSMISRGCRPSPQERSEQQR